VGDLNAEIGEAWKEPATGPHEGPESCKSGHTNLGAWAGAKVARVKREVLEIWCLFHLWETWRKPAL
jgi:hypothetical protein